MDYVALVENGTNCFKKKKQAENSSHRVSVKFPSDKNCADCGGDFVNDVTRHPGTGYCTRCVLK